MPNYLVTSPDGKQFSVTAPPGATETDAINYLRQNLEGTGSGNNAQSAFAPLEENYL